MVRKPVYVTSQGLARLRQELEELTQGQRPELVERLHEAKEGSDWMDNTEYRLVEDELAFVEGRIQELEDMLSAARLIEPDDDENTVNIGDTAFIQANGDVEQYTIVGVAEADPAAGLISNESPLARALLQHKVGDEVAVKAPGGTFYVRIVAVKCSMNCDEETS
ncbi:MAG: transcription elongation factor GreA [bacterium]